MNPLGSFGCDSKSRITTLTHAMCLMLLLQQPHCYSLFQSQTHMHGMAMEATNVWLTLPSYHYQFGIEQCPCGVSNLMNVASVPRMSCTVQSK